MSLYTATVNPIDATVPRARSKEALFVLAKPVLVVRLDTFDADALALVWARETFDNAVMEFNIAAIRSIAGMFFQYCITVLVLGRSQTKEKLDQVVQWLADFEIVTEGYYLPVWWQYTYMLVTLYSFATSLLFLGCK